MTETNGNGDRNGRIDEDACERYLFGEMTEAEQETFEASYFSDDGFFERFVAVKEDLLDLYSRGELPVEKRIRLDGHFLKTRARKERINEAGEFIRNVTAVYDRHGDPKLETQALSSAPATGFFGFLSHLFTPRRLAAAAVLFFGLAGGMWILNRSSANEVRDAVLIAVQEDPASANRQIGPAAHSTEGEEETTILVELPTGQKKFRGVEDLERSALLSKKKRARTDLLHGGSSAHQSSPATGPAPTSGLAIGGRRDSAVELSGTVVGPKGEPVGSATVTARNLITDAVRSITAAPDGTYTFTKLPSGEYEVSSEAPNLMRTVMPPVRIADGVSAQLRIPMKPGVEQAVVNSAGVPPDPPVNEKSATPFALTISTVGRDDERTTRVTLEPNATRDLGEMKTVTQVTIRSSTREVLATLIYRGGPYRRYEATLTTVDGNVVWRKRNIKSTAPQSVAVRIPSSVFKKMDYLIVLSGKENKGKTEIINEYYLHAVREPGK